MNTTEKAIFIIKNRHREAMLERERMLQTLRKNNDFCALENSLDVLKWEYAKNVAYEKPVDTLQKQINGVEKEIAEFLQNNGVSINILEENYLCPICKDTGIINGKLCVCAEKERVNLVLEENPFLKTVPEKLEDINFSFYKDLGKNYKKYVDFIEKYFLYGDKSFLIISGGAGVGKTYLAYTALKQALLSGVSVKILDSIKLNKKFLDYHCAALSDKQIIWEEIISSDILLIDDFGAEQLFNNVTLPYLYELLVDRMNKKTIFTTNLDLPNLEIKYGQRLFSRFCDVRNSAFLPINAPDFRFM
ncbi:hypothetical protein EOM82_01035 [bacterium]|nr:hypothetical protein [bacterium]